MTDLEKVEKLRERANVSYEEAKTALEQCNGDLLEAMVLLERQGKVKAPEKSTYSTSYEEQKEYISVAQKVEESNEDKKTFGSKLKDFIKKLWKKGNDNYFCVSKDDGELFRIPAWVFVLIIILTWQLSLIAMVVALFFGCKYSFVGKDEMGTVNKAFDKASDIADKVKDEFK